MAAQAKPDPRDSGDRKPESRTNACEQSIDRNAPAGSASSLGAKSDCNGRPDTDASVVEVMDEAGPLRKEDRNSGSGK